MARTTYKLQVIYLKRTNNHGNFNLTFHMEEDILSYILF